MRSSAKPVLLKGAHVIDPGQGIDGVQDVALENGKIRPVAGLPPDVETLDLTGSYLTPGWIDIHVHVYGTLGFADPDSIGVCQGVTSYVEAGGPGIGTLDEFLALLEDRTQTTLYAGRLEFSV
jgi:dihydroorotase